MLVFSALTICKSLIGKFAASQLKFQKVDLTVYHRTSMAWLNCNNPFLRSFFRKYVQMVLQHWCQSNRTEGLALGKQFRGSILLFLLLSASSFCKRMNWKEKNSSKIVPLFNCLKTLHKSLLNKFGQWLWLSNPIRHQRTVVWIQSTYFVEYLFNVLKRLT